MSDEYEDLHDEITEAIEDLEDEQGVELTDEQFDHLGRQIAAYAEYTGVVDAAATIEAIAEAEQLAAQNGGPEYDEDPQVYDEAEHEAAIVNLEREIGRELTRKESNDLWQEVPEGSDRDHYFEAFRGPTPRQIASDEQTRIQHTAQHIEDVDAEQREAAEERGETVEEPERQYSTPGEQALTEALETPEGDTDGYTE